jgi:hypothetical protein
MAFISSGCIENNSKILINFNSLNRRSEIGLFQITVSIISTIDLMEISGWLCQYERRLPPQAGNA